MDEREGHVAGVGGVDGHDHLMLDVPEGMDEVGGRQGVDGRTGILAELAEADGQLDAEGAGVLEDHVTAAGELAELT